MSTLVFTQEPSQIASGGGTATVTDSDDQSWVIEKIQITEDAQNDLAGATATISIAGNSVTDQNVDLGTYQAEYSEIPPQGIVWPANDQFSMDITNNSGSNINVSIMLWVRPATDGEVGRGGGALVRD